MIRTKLGLCILALILINNAFAADAQTNAAIDSVVNAYGGEKLINVKTLELTGTEMSRWPGQGYFPGRDQPEFNRQTFVFNPNEMLAYKEIKSLGNNSVIHYGDVIDDETTMSFNLISNVHYDPDEGGYYGSLGGYIRGFDTMLAFELNKRRNTAKVEGSSNYRGQPHTIISMEFPNSPPLFMTIDDRTGYIVKMTRTFENNETQLDYYYNKHQIINGIAFSQSYAFMQDDNLRISSSDRSLKVNKTSAKIFTLPSNLSKRAEMMPEIEGPSQTKISDTFHHISADGYQSAFITGDEYAVSVGGSAGFGERYKVYQAIEGSKPLRYHVITHHHVDHLDGVEDAAATGATLVVLANTVELVRDIVGDDFPSDRIMSISSKTTLGPVDIHLVSTNHTETLALVYARDDKTLFEADHYGGEHLNAVSPAYLNGVNLKRDVDPLGLDIEFLVGPHSRKAHRWVDFVGAVESFKSKHCKPVLSGCPQ